MDVIAHYAKFVAALLGAFMSAFAGLLPPEVSPWAQAVIAFLTAAAVVLVPNKPATSTTAKHRAD